VIVRERDWLRIRADLDARFPGAGCDADRPQRLGDVDRLVHRSARVAKRRLDGDERDNTHQRREPRHPTTGLAQPLGSVHCATAVHVTDDLNVEEGSVLDDGPVSPMDSEAD